MKLKAFFINKQSNAFRAAAVCCAFLTTSVSADIRALVKFDGSGHQLHRVVQVSGTKTNADEVNLGVVGQGYAVVRWFDINGDMIRETVIDDPRVTHAPLSAQQSGPTYLAITEGAYLLEGPDSSVILQVDLPPIAGIGLAAETWRLTLSE